MLPVVVITTRLSSCTNDAGAPFDSHFVMHVTGRMPDVADASFGAIVSVRNGNRGYGCVLSATSNAPSLTLVDATSSPNVAASSAIDTPPVGDSVFIRMGIENEPELCEVEYGLGLTQANFGFLGSGPRATGSVAVTVGNSTTEVHGLTAVRFQPGVACVPILR